MLDHLSLCMDLFGNLLESYQSGKGWSVPYFTPEQMAFVGLRYLGKGDRVKCSFCNVELDNWSNWDDPYMKHKLYSPSCSLFENKSHDKEHRALLEWSVVLHKINRSAIRVYLASFDNRLKTFEDCKKKLYQDPQSLCEAGFYYKGDGKNDEVSCFCCNTTLFDWKKRDDPWAEHAKSFPNCSYVLLTKGKIFVVKVYEAAKLLNFRNKPLVNSLNVSPDQGRVLKMTLRKRKLTNETTPDQEKNDFTTPDDDNLLCKVCLTAESTIVIMACGHFFSCISCILSLETCAICRNPIDEIIKAITIPDRRINNPRLPGTSSQSQNSISKSNICKICYEKEMKVLYVPCRHLVACMECAQMTKKCNICNVDIFSIFPVYL